MSSEECFDHLEVILSNSIDALDSNQFDCIFLRTTVHDSFMSRVARHHIHLIGDPSGASLTSEYLGTWSGFHVIQYFKDLQLDIFQLFRTVLVLGVGGVLVRCIGFHLILQCVAVG